MARGLIARAGQPLAAPSANRSNRLSPTAAEHVLADLDGRIDLILDSGPTTVGLESTVLDLTRRPPAILRPGPIGPAELDRCLGRPAGSSRHASLAASDADPASSPGMLRSTTPRGRRPSGSTRSTSWRGSPGRSGRRSSSWAGTRRSRRRRRAPIGAPRLRPPRRSSLYAALHQLDALGLDLIVVVDARPIGPSGRPSATGSCGRRDRVDVVTWRP